MAVNGIELEEGQRWVTRSGEVVTITNVGATNPRFPWVVRDEKNVAIATVTSDGREFINDDEGHNDLICFSESVPGRIVQELVSAVDRRRPGNPVDTLSCPMRRRSDWPGMERSAGEVPDLAAPPQDFVASVTGELEGASALDVQIGGSHYKNFAIQPVEFIHRNGIGFPEGNAIKYLCRWREKGGIKDLQKAKHYIDLLIQMETTK